MFTNIRVKPRVMQMSFINMLSPRTKSLLAGDLIAKNPVLKSQVSNPSGEKFDTTC